MGDRYHLQIKCGGCGEKNPPDSEELDLYRDGVYYAPSSCFMSFTCHACKKINWIEHGFHGRVVSKEEEKELYKLNGCE